MNADVLAKGLEKCRLLTTLLGQNVENLDDYGNDNSRTCQNGQFVDLLYLPFPTQNKASLCREESKGVRRRGYATFVNFCTCFLFLSLLLI